MRQPNYLLLNSLGKKSYERFRAIEDSQEKLKKEGYHVLNQQSRVNFIYFCIHDSLLFPTHNAVFISSEGNMVLEWADVGGKYISITFKAHRVDYAIDSKNVIKQDSEYEAMVDHLYKYLVGRKKPVGSYWHDQM